MLYGNATPFSEAVKNKDQTYLIGLVLLNNLDGFENPTCSLCCKTNRNL